MRQETRAAFARLNARLQAESDSLDSERREAMRDEVGDSMPFEELEGAERAIDQRVAARAKAKK